MSFLRSDFEAKDTAGQYMKFSQGENRIRVLSDAIDGFVYWVDVNDVVVLKGELGGEGAKPVRVRSLAEGESKHQSSQYNSKQFVTFVVWNYELKKVQVLEITQKTLIKELQGLYLSEDWGDPKEYDIVIEKTGEKLTTEYTVRPIPPKKFAEEVDVSNINLEALYEGGDPFNSDSVKLDPTIF